MCEGVIIGDAAAPHGKTTDDSGDGRVRQRFTFGMAPPASRVAPFLMFEKLIVGFDGTDTGWDGLVLATGLAEAFGSVSAEVVPRAHCPITVLPAGPRTAPGT
jgi:hypothetical protein